MERKIITPRKDWEKKVEEVGLTFHHVDGEVYWNEGACYFLTSKEVDVIDDATAELNQLCLKAVEHVIAKDRFADLKIPVAAIPFIKRSWQEEKSRTLYGRFDLVCDGVNPPKMLEYNADTPTALLEASIIQWYWLQDFRKDADQFNSLHEKLVERFRELKRELKGIVLYFAHTYAEDITEDTMTVNYLRDAAEEAGILTEDIIVDDIGWDEEKQSFVDLEGTEIRAMFKLYPWEWIVQEEFGGHAMRTYDAMTWIEPIWKMILSNKGILPILWEMFPDHPNLLPAYFDGPHGMEEYVKKPILSREGANISIHKKDSSVIETEGTYGQEGFVYQQFSPLPDFDGNRPVIGSWIIGSKTAGIGIRETRSDITDNASTFVPHYFE